MTNFGKIFSGDLTNWLIDVSGLNKSQCQMSIYYKYTPDVSKLVVLPYIDYCVYCYTYEELGRRFVDTIGIRLCVNLLGYTHWFISIIISQLKYYSISVEQARYDTDFVSKYLYTTTKNMIPNSIKLPCLMIWYSPNKMPPPVMKKWKHSL